MDEIILEFGGVAYYLDFDGLQDMLKGDSDLEPGIVTETETKVTNINGGIEKTEITTKEYPKGREIDI